MDHPKPRTEPRLLTVKEVCRLVIYSRTHLYRMQRDGLFPQRVKVGLARVGFWEHEIHAWLKSRPYAGPTKEDDDDLSPPSPYRRRKRSPPNGGNGASP